MKIYKFLGMACIGLLLLLGCNKKDEVDTVEEELTGTVKVINGSYNVVIGNDSTVDNVIYHQGDTVFEDFIKTNVRADLVTNSENKSLYDFILYNVTFSNHMPVSIDMTIPGLSLSGDSIYGDSIVPLAGALGPYPRFLVRNFRGFVKYNNNNQVVNFNANMLCGKYQTSFISK